MLSMERTMFGCWRYAEHREGDIFFLWFVCYGTVWKELFIGAATIDKQFEDLSSDRHAVL